MEFTINELLVIDTPCQKGFWNDDAQLYTSIWNTPISMEEEDYREEIRKFFSVIKEHRPQYIFVKAQNAKYNVQPQTQEWITQEYFEIYVKIHLKKMAWVVSQDFFAQISFQQTMAEAPVLPFEMKYFEEEQEAERWILG